MCEEKVREERRRCADIALDIWKGKPAKYVPWYKKVGQEVAAKVLGAEGIKDAYPNNGLKAPTAEEI